MGFELDCRLRVVAWRTGAEGGAFGAPFGMLNSELTKPSSDLRQRACGAVRISVKSHGFEWILRHLGLT